MPNNIKIQKIVYTNNEEMNKINIFYSENTMLFIYPNQNLIPNDIKDVADTYTKNGTEHYIYKEIKQVDWFTGNTTYSLIGNFSESEFKQITDSLYQ